jgi:hypothetical protein
MPFPNPTPADIKRFMSYVDVLPNGCWFWTGGRSRGKGNKKWYGSFSYQGVTVRAHTFAHDHLGDDHRPCPPGFHRDHTCNFSLCVCPTHLECVPRKVNQERKVARKAAAARGPMPKGLVMVLNGV